MAPYEIPSVEFEDFRVSPLLMPVLSRGRGQQESFQSPHSPTESDRDFRAELRQVWNPDLGPLETASLTLLSPPSPRRPPSVVVSDSSALAENEDEDEALQQAIALSEQTAAMEERRRRQYAEQLKHVSRQPGLNVNGSHRQPPEIRVHPSAKGKQPERATSLDANEKAMNNEAFPDTHDSHPDDGPPPEYGSLTLLTHSKSVQNLETLQAHSVAAAGSPSDTTRHESNEPSLHRKPEAPVQRILRATTEPLLLATGEQEALMVQDRPTSKAPLSPWHAHSETPTGLEREGSVAYQGPQKPARNLVLQLTSIKTSKDPHASEDTTAQPPSMLRTQSHEPASGQVPFQGSHERHTEVESFPSRHTSLRSGSSVPRRRPSSTYRPPRTPVLCTSPETEPALHATSPPRLTVPTEGERTRRSSQSSGKLSIRDSSRSRSSSVSHTSGEMCDACRNVGSQRSFCNVCDYVFCNACWDMQMAHKGNRLAMGSVPHEKTEAHIAKTVHGVLAPSLTELQCEELHTADIDTTWFGVVRADSEFALPMFRDYGRFAILMKQARESINAASLSPVGDCNEKVYPSLVSFVGETGAGKSTVIRLLIELKSEAAERDRFPTPVVGAAGRDLATSEDVHLYLDPDSSESQVPLVFADCEGLGGGEREPVGARLKRKLERQAAGSSGSHGMKRLKHTYERELAWANNDVTKKREYAVAHLYPRLLYTFSDVIVFVLRNPRRIEAVLERLVEWAQAALEKSSNQPLLPHAIIALNASENNIEEQLWEVDIATTKLLHELSRTIYENATFKRWAQFWRKRDRQIETVEQLLLSYYSSIRVVRIPTVGRPNLISAQIDKLSCEIRDASKTARENKADLRMLLDADEFEPYLQTAFDHFAETLNTPFDFVQASFTNSPIPNTFEGNILKVAIEVMECWKDKASGASIFEELSYIVASCIMLDTARYSVKGSVESIFPQYLEHIDSALVNFCLSHWPCEYVASTGGRCINVRSGHAKGHQLTGGTLLAAKGYEAAFTAESHGKKWQEDVYHKMAALRKYLRDQEEDGHSEEATVAKLHREQVLPQFIEHASRGDEHAFKSHTVCVCCLFEPPEHALPCGHIICTRCLKTYGKVYFNGRYVEITECPMERIEKRYTQSWRINLKPPSCGIRMLILDGGGIRGVVELEILNALEKELGGRLMIQKFFDLIVGTSCGGIIALGLTASHWKVHECIDAFTGLCRKAFTGRKGMKFPVVNKLVQSYHHSKYETQPLQEALISAFTENEYLFGGRRSNPASLDYKVAVAATSTAGNPIVFANYNRLCTEKLPYHFQRPEKLEAEMKVWEAARGTSAAPGYFKPLCHDSSKQVIFDGGPYNNNPINIADRERKLLWPNHKDSEPDMVLSIGTSYCDEDKPKRHAEWPSSSTGILQYRENMQRIAKDHVSNSLDGEQTWLNYLSVRNPDQSNKGRYIRLNLKLPRRPPKLDNVAEMRPLQELTERHFVDNPVIKQIACKLVASSFYFDSIGEVKETFDSDVYEVTGFIKCRFNPGPEIVELGKFIKAKATAGHEAHFLIRSHGDEEMIGEEKLIDTRVLNRMIYEQQFRMEEIRIRRNSKYAVTDMSLCFTRDTSFPISGFPRGLHAAKSTYTPNRHVLKSTDSYRWAGRTSSQHKRRRDWCPPNVAPPMEKRDIIQRYSDSSHILGNATGTMSMTLRSYYGTNVDGYYAPDDLRVTTIQELDSASTSGHTASTAAFPLPHRLDSDTFSPQSSIYPSTWQWGGEMDGTNSSHELP